MSSEEKARECSGIENGNLTSSFAFSCCGYHSLHTCGKVDVSITLPTFYSTNHHKWFIKILIMIEKT